MKGDKTVNITIKGGGIILNIPVIPPKVNVSDGSSTPKTVTIWRKGEVDFNDGKSLDGLSWSSFFPSRYDASYCNSKNLKTVQWYINTINKWKNAGTVVQVIIPAMNINRSMKIKTFQGDYEGQTAIKKGDKVQFKGGPVYISSDASRPAVTRGKAKCNCTIVNSNKHPYHLIHYSGAMVYGWVNASDCEKI